MRNEIYYLKKMPNHLKLQNTNPDINTINSSFPNGITDAYFLLEAKKNIQDPTLIEKINSICDERILQYLTENFISTIDGSVFNIMSKFDRLRVDYSLCAFIDSLKQRIEENSPAFSQDRKAYQLLLKAYSSYAQLHDTYIDQLEKGDTIYNHLEISLPSVIYGEQPKNGEVR